LRRLFTGASKPPLRNIFNKGTDSDRQETSLIVNGGHYMTRGHVILRMLYIKDVPDVKNYFGTGRGPFRVCKRTPAEGVFAPAGIDEFLRILDGFVKSPDAALRFILRHCGVHQSTPHFSGFARLACGHFTKPSHFRDF
jgi:hypothetical protein